MEKYKEFIEYGRVKTNKAPDVKPIIKPLSVLIIIFGLLSIFGSIVESKGLFVVILINIINIFLIIILMPQIKSVKKENQNLSTALTFIVMLMCCFEVYYVLLIDYNRISIFGGLMCFSGVEVIFITIALMVVSTVFTVIATKRNISKRLYRNRKVQGIKSEHITVIVPVGILIILLLSSGESILMTITAALVAIGIFLFYIVRCYMRYYYIKKYNL